MKKLLLTFLATVGIAVLLPASAFAAKTTTFVSGTVTNNGSPVKGASVVVTCGSVFKTDTTAKDGSYSVKFNAKNCPVGSTVIVSADKGKKKVGSNTGKVTASDVVDLNIASVNVSLPEMGYVTTAGAAVLGGGALYVIRRRSLGANA